MKNNLPIKLIVAQDNHYEKYENGIVYDKETNLEWVVGPDKCTYGHTAKYWVAHLDLDGGGWRKGASKKTGLLAIGLGIQDSKNPVDYHCNGSNHDIMCQKV